MTICTIRAFLEIFGPMLGLCAAFAWITSAWFGRFTILDEVVESTMASQSRWYAYAAIFASLSAVAQFSISFMPVCHAFS
jgi:hypothetical protein